MSLKNDQGRLILMQRALVRMRMAFEAGKGVRLSFEELEEFNRSLIGEWWNVPVEDSNIPEKTCFCLWCINLDIDVLGGEVRCSNGYSLRFYKGEGFKRRCAAFTHDNDVDTIDRGKILTGMGYRDFYVPKYVAETPPNDNFDANQGENP